MHIHTISAKKCKIIFRRICLNVSIIIIIRRRRRRSSYKKELISGA